MQKLRALSKASNKYGALRPQENYRLSFWRFLPLSCWSCVFYPCRYHHQRRRQTHKAYKLGEMPNVGVKGTWGQGKSWLKLTEEIECRASCDVCVRVRVWTLLPSKEC